MEALGEIWFWAKVAIAGMGLASMLYWVFRGEREALERDKKALEEEKRALVQENQSLHQQLERAYFGVRAIFEFTVILGSTLKLEEMLNLMIDTILRITPYDACALYLFENESRNLKIRVARGLSQQTIEEVSFRPGEGLVGWVAQTNQPALVLDSKHDPRYQYLKHENFFRSILALPLIVKEKTIGVLEIDKVEPHAYSDEDLRILSIVANQVAFAIRNVQLYEEVLHLAITDGLTGLYNHRHFRTVIEREVRRAERFKRDISLVMLDVDYFKGINDEYGHQTGDAVLVEVAKILKETVRETDFVARYGGEEFVILLPETGLQEAALVAERICKAVAAHSFPHGQPLTVSAGVATYPQQAQSADELISAADTMCYQAKQAGRDQVCYLNLRRQVG